MSEKPKEKTSEEHLDYLESGNKLFLWWAWKRVKDDPGLKLTDIILNETGIVIENLPVCPSGSKKIEDQ